MPKPNTYITLNIPLSLYKDFLDFLDSAQCQYTEEDLHMMAPNQADVITYVSHIVGESATPRFRSIKEMKKKWAHQGKELNRR